jgi:hypothetical protein
VAQICQTPPKLDVLVLWMALKQTGVDSTNISQGMVNMIVFINHNIFCNLGWQMARIYQTNIKARKNTVSTC